MQHGRTGLPPLDTDFAKVAWVRPAAVVDYPDGVIYLEHVTASGRTRATPGNNFNDFMTAHGYS